jgi:DUF4097 and DUF4098 domain-containing protein YvlB
MLKRVLVTSLVLTVVAMIPQVATLHSARQRTDEARSAVLPDATNATGGGGDEVREEFHQTYPLSANGRIILENLNGGVRINVWDRNEVQLNAVKRAYNRERLGEAKIDVVASPDSIRIKTKYPDYDQSFTDDERGRYSNPAIVDYALTVPRQARLESVDLINGSLDIEGTEGDVKASSVNGRVSARGLMGEARLSTVNGSLEAVFTRLDESKAISLGSVNGNVSLVIPSNANAIVRAGTVHGAITNDFGLEVQHGDYVGHELYGQIGTGGPRIKLGNVNGRIQIKRSQDGGLQSPGTSLLSPKDKKHKEKEKEKALEGKLNEAVAENREMAAEARREALENLEQVRIAKQAEAEARREADRAIREAQREIRQAQNQVQREQQRQAQRVLREQMRSEARGAGTGAGKGEGHGAGVAGRRFAERESKSFTVTGKPRVNINTYEGVVIVHGWDKPEVMYTATKRSGEEQELKQITIKAEQQGSEVSIIAINPDAGGTANLEVYLPRTVSLNVSSNDGRLTLEGVSGDLTMRTGDGSIEVANSHGTLKAITGNGNIRVLRFEGQLEARTGDGPISLDGKFTALSARTGSGSVVLAVPADLNFTIETNTEELTNEGLTITEDLAPSKRVKRWKVGRGGQVFVISTGEGKVLLRPR